MNGEPEKQNPSVALWRVPQPANDSRPVFERLADYATRGTDSPESLSLYEIRQVSFALSLYLAIDAENR